jgi:uncharacterized phage protein gp47/JayE
MATYGLHSLGFTPKTLVVIRDELNAALRAVFGASIDLTDKSILGQLVGIISEHLALLWEQSEATNSSQDVDKATGAALEALCLLTGTFRSAATFSAVTLTLTGDPTTVVPSGTRVATDSTEVEFALSADATIVALTAWAALTSYAVGDQRYNGDNAYVCTIAGTSDVSGGPIDTDTAIVDASVTWRFLGEGTGAVEAAALATETGPVEAYAYDITVIVNAVSGFDGVLNLNDATLGRAIMTDSELRLLREQELATGGSSPINALRAELLRIADVVSVSLFVNNTDITDDDGVPPHSIEALVRGPESPDSEFDQSIWDALLAGVAAGIRTHGDEVGTATDDEQTEHEMAFTRPTELDIYVDVTVTKDPDEYPADGDDLVKEAIVDYGDLQLVGKDVVASRIAAAVFDVAGVLDVDVRIYTDVIGTATTWTALTAYVASAGSRSVVTNGGRAYICITSGTSAASGGPLSASTDITDGTVHWRYLGATIPATLRELAVFDTTRIDVESEDGTP